MYRRAGQLQRHERHSIWIVHQKNLSERHGEVTHLVEIAKAFEKLGHTVTLIGPGVGTVPSGVNVVQLWCLDTPRSLRLITYELSLWIWFLTRWVVCYRERPILYVRKGALLLAPFIIGRVLRLQVFVEVNDVSSAAVWPGRRVPYMVKKALDEIARFEYRVSTQVVAVTDAIKEDLVFSYGAHPEKVAVVSNGANVDVFRPHEITECRLRLHLPTNGHLIVFVGNLVPWQGLDTAIDAMSLLRNSNTTLLVVGDGIQRKELEARVEKRGLGSSVKFVGTIPFTEVPYYIGAADVCIAPFGDSARNKRGVSALKVFEYMACGRPVVTTEAMAAVVGTAGSVFPAGDAEALASVLAELLADPEKRARMGAIGRERCASSYSWLHAAETIWTLVQRSA